MRRRLTGRQGIPTLLAAVLLLIPAVPAAALHAVSAAGPVSSSPAVPAATPSALPAASSTMLAAVPTAAPSTSRAEVPSASPGTPRAADSVGLTLDLRRSFLSTRRDGARVLVRVRLDAAAVVRLRVTDFDGRTVRDLFRGRRPPGRLTRTWDGRDRAGELVAAGPYRVVASASAAGDDATDAGPQEAEAWVTVAERRVYPRRPGFITIAVDPGHGGSFDGAVGADGTREADLNLDIGLRLTHMLEGAGVTVALTRDGDSHVNEPPLDLTADGVIDETDELAARPDVANRARADLFIAIHNNMAVNEAVGGPSTYYVGARTFGDRSARLARIIQDGMVAALRAIPAGRWQPYDHGALEYPYYVLRDYDPPRLLRPTQMPGVLSEGLFLSNPRELRLLRQQRVRQAMATAYYHAIATYLAQRGSHVGYELRSGPALATAGKRVVFVIEVRNQGSESMKGWDLVVGAVPTEWPYVGRARSPEAVGERRIPRLEPGETATLSLEVTTPERGQEWMLLFDARDRDGRPASRGGSPVLQVPLTTGAPVPEVPDPSGP